jgi:phosphoglycolate phosphatase-like HAD superfamily hydrolase
MSSVRKVKQQVLLWDMDGTLLNTGGAGVVPLTKAVSNFLGEPVSFDRKATSGLTDYQIVSEILSAWGAMTPTLEDIENILLEYSVGLKFALASKPPMVLGQVESVLADISQINGYKSVICTGNFHAGAKIKLASCGLDSYFLEENMFCANDVGHRSQIVKRVKDEFANQDARLWVIGDTPHDISGAKANNVGVIAVESAQFSSDDLLPYAPDFVLSQNWSTSELLTLLES